MTPAKLTILCSVFALIAGCGGGGGGDGGAQSPTELTGKFVDSGVAGIAYTCGFFSGTTDLAGTFSYEAGSTCTFKIGGITLGSASGAPIVTPVSLVNGAVDESDPVVANISRLLISLDSDNNPSNGIDIAGSVRTALASASLDVTNQSTFDSLASALVATAIPGRTLASSAYARGHLNVTLLSLLAGPYSCNYSGSDSGTASVNIANGYLSGSGTSRDTGAFSLSGSVFSSGATTLTTGAASTGATFSGTFTTEGTGSGTWQAFPDSGTWSCRRV